MQFIIGSLALFLAGCNAQSLSSVLAGAKDLSDLKTVLGKYPAIVNTLASAKGITILAPIDGSDGMDRLVSSVEGALAPIVARTSPGLIESTLTYHVLKGVFPASAIPANAFVETLLTNANYSSVTGGQRVQVSKKNGKVTVTGAGRPISVVKADIKFDGGVIHLIDGVLSAPISPVKVATAAGLSSLISSLGAAGLASAVENAKDITIFAPTNAAFTAAGSLLKTLTAAQVSSALTYHVVKGVGYSSDLKNGQTLPTLQGGTVKVTIANGVVSVNGAKVVKADVLTKNGVVHVIDSVLVPSL